MPRRFLVFPYNTMFSRVSVGVHVASNLSSRLGGGMGGGGGRSSTFCPLLPALYPSFSALCPLLLACCPQPSALYSIPSTLCPLVSGWRWLAGGRGWLGEGTICVGQIGFFLLRHSTPFFKRQLLLLFLEPFVEKKSMRLHHAVFPLWFSYVVRTFFPGIV